MSKSKKNRRIFVRLIKKQPRKSYNKTTTPLPPEEFVIATNKKSVRDAREGR